MGVGSHSVGERPSIRKRAFSEYKRPNTPIAGGRPAPPDSGSAAAGKPNRWTGKKERRVGMRVKKWIWTSLGLGILAILAVLVSILALHDIYTGESDVTAEWSAIVVCFAIILLSQVTNLVTLTKLLRGRT